MFDYTVIGNGLIGSAAGRYLSATGKRVALIGPGEPENLKTHQGVFGSHYDQGRLTRIMDEDLVWALLAKRSIAQYRFIKRESGVNFYNPVDGLQVGPVGSDFISSTRRVGEEAGAEFSEIDPDQLQAGLRHYRFPAGAAGLLETGGAGYINPRSLVKAQLTIAQRQGATLIRETVADLQLTEGAVNLTTAEGNTYQSRRVLIAAGGFANQLLSRPLAITPNGITILLAEVSEAEVERLTGLPTLIYRIPNPDQIPSIYMAPPVRYADGKFYLKIGGSLEVRKSLPTFAERRDWFHTDGDPVEGEGLREILHAIIPNLKALSYHTQPCIITMTPSDYPMIDTLEPGRIYVAAGGCGSAAKSSNEIGHIAARLMENDGWQYDLSANTFKAVYAD